MNDWWIRSLFCLSFHYDPKFDSEKYLPNKFMSNAWGEASTKLKAYVGSANIDVHIKTSSIQEEPSLRKFYGLETIYWHFLFGGITR